ncbi:MAG: undecaprenyl-diphosphatase UppP [Armatimonadota bacterium]
MNLIQAIILGAVQGLGEFIPISSSAHLVVIPKVFGWRTPGLTFDVALHLGTLVALLAYFWRDWYEMAKAHLAATRLGPRFGMVPVEGERLLLWPIVFASVPAALAGVKFEDAVSTVFRNPLLIALTMIGMGLILLAADRLGRKSRPVEKVGLREWAIIGLAQALAIVPGVSRSGITITAGLLCGLEREAAARFSFLLGAPVILGAAVYELRHVFTDGLPAGEAVPFVAGVVTAGVVGYLCIGFLLNYLRKRSVDIFVGYRLIFGIAVIAMSVFGYLTR